MSARGLAIKTADPAGEEFPLFKSFWLERPAPSSRADGGPRAAGQPERGGRVSFHDPPGQETVFDTEAALYPRVDITQAGAGAADQHVPVRRQRPQPASTTIARRCTISNGLQMHTGQDERIWRPLANPRDSADQRLHRRQPARLRPDAARAQLRRLPGPGSRYEKRPSLWVEPIGDWGEGVVELVEIPSDREVNDNMVAFWRPHDPLRAKGENILNYRLHWCWAAPGEVPLGAGDADPLRPVVGPEEPAVRHRFRRRRAEGVDGRQAAQPGYRQRQGQNCQCGSGIQP